MDSTKKRTVRTVCGICACHIVDVEVEGDEVRKVSMAPISENRGQVVCVKGHKAFPWNYRDGRLTYPMMRNGKGGLLRRVSWDEALDAVADKLNAIKMEYGPEAVYFYPGTVYIFSNVLGLHYLSKFITDFGSPNHGSYGENCFLPRIISNIVTFGGVMTSDTDPEAEPGCICLWGCNLSASQPSLAASLLKFKRKKGSKLIFIDPRKVGLAKNADIYLPVRPGTDTALALAMINVIIEEKIYDREFVENYTSGFDKLAEQVKKYRPEFVEGRVGISASQIRETARMLAQHPPVMMYRLLGGFETTMNGFQGHRAVDIILALTGSVDKQSANIITEPGNGWLVTRSLLEIPHTGGLGDQFHPLMQKMGGGWTPATPLNEALLTGKPYPIKGLVVCGANPAVLHPNTSKMLKALKKPDLFVAVVDVKFSETCAYADVILPACTTLERSGLSTMWSGYENDFLAWFDPVLPPQGEALPDHEIWVGLGKRFGCEFPKTYEDGANSMVLAPLGLTVEDLKKKAYQYDRNKVEKYKEKGFNTPSKKVELYSTMLEENGYDPLPEYQEGPETPVSTPSIAKQYPLQAIDFRYAHFWHSRFRNVPDLKKITPEPEAEINPKDAERYGIADGDLVRVESLRGAVEMKAKTTEDIRQGVVAMPMGWPGKANVDLLTSDELHHRDPLTGGALYRGYLCRIEKV